MLDVIEESVYSREFYRNRIPATTIEHATSIITNARALSATLGATGTYAHLYTSISSADSDADIRVATLVVAACIKLCSTSWKIFDEKYIWNIVPRIPQVAAALQLCRQGSSHFALQRTGEGKTVTILVAIALLAKRGNVHVVTANDYLAQRDSQWIGPVLQKLGISCSFLTKERSHKRTCYAAQVLFGSDKEFIFDYLRDSIRTPGELPLCTSRDQVIVDEGDHILLDELMTPAIISRETPYHNTLLEKADTIVRVLLQKQEHYCTALFDTIKNRDPVCNKHLLTTITRLRHSNCSSAAIIEFFDKNQSLACAAEQYESRRFMQGDATDWYTNELYVDINSEEKWCCFTDLGMEYIEKEFGKTLFTLPETAIGNLDHYQLLTALHNALEAHTLLVKDVDYIVRNSTIEVITTSIGRADHQKKFGHGLAGAVAVKEGIVYRSDAINATRTTIVSFVKEYRHAAVLSGTLLPDHTEFTQLYGAKAFPVPPYKPIIAHHAAGKIYGSVNRKYEALIEEVLYFHAMGRPVLIGVTSIRTSETIAAKLGAAGVTVRVMNAKTENQEAQIIAGAGAPGTITVATTMAGRGCDIAVPENTDHTICHNFTSTIISALQQHSTVTIECTSHYEVDLLYKKISGATANRLSRQKKGKLFIITIIGNGTGKNLRLPFGLGLHVVIAECCSSRRIETQFRGRTGRQGRPGSSSLYIALEDDVLVPFSTLRWFCHRVNRLFSLNRHGLLKHFFLLLINLATEGEMRTRRHERLFYDGVSDIIRNRFTAMREQALTAASLHTVQSSIRFCLAYLNEEAAFIKNHDARDAMVRTRLQEIFSLDAGSLPGVLLNESGCIDCGIEQWIAGVALLKKIPPPESEVRFLYCCCIDESWCTFAAMLESFQEQAYFLAFAGRDPKVSYIAILFAQWHESIYRFYETFLTRLFLQPSHSVKKLKTATNSADDELEKLFAL